MDKMRRTEHQRRVDIAEAELEAMIQVIALEELNRLFRGVQLKLRRINQYRPKAHPNHTRLTKADVTGTSLWDLFRGRLRSRLLEALLGGSISLYSLLTMRVAEQPLELDTDAIARELEYQVGERITQVTNTIKREVGRRIVAWYNSPGVPMQTIINQLRPTFGINRAELIASNEITELDSAVQFQIASRLGIQKYWWGSKRDSLVCVKPITGPDGKIYNGCRELHGKIFDINMPMPPKGSHIKCRCKAHLILPKPTSPTETPIIDISHLVKAEFVEDEHPRDKGGEFTSKGGEGAGGKMEKPVKVVRSEKKEGEGIDSEGRHTFHGSRFSKTVTEKQRNGIITGIKTRTRIPPRHLEGIEFITDSAEFYMGGVYEIDEGYGIKDTEGRIFPGVYNTKSKQVLIAPKCAEEYRYYAIDVAHEIGHHVDINMVHNFTDKEIMNKMKKSKKNMLEYGLRTYSFTTQYEFMADVYMACFCNNLESVSNKLAELFEVKKVEDIWEKQ